MVQATVNVALPEALVDPETVVMVGVPAPVLPFLASVTVLPGTPLLLASFRVTVIVEVVPSAVTEAGNAVTVEAVALTGPVTMFPLEAVVTLTEVAPLLDNTMFWELYVPTGAVAARRT